MTTDGGGAMAIAVNGKGSSHEERKKIALWRLGVASTVWLEF